MGARSFGCGAACVIKTVIEKQGYRTKPAWNQFFRKAFLIGMLEDVVRDVGRFREGFCGHGAARCRHREIIPHRYGALPEQMAGRLDDVFVLTDCSFPQHREESEKILGPFLAALEARGLAHARRGSRQDGIGERPAGERGRQERTDRYDGIVPMRACPIRDQPGEPLRDGDAEKGRHVERRQRAARKFVRIGVAHVRILQHLE
jgi:hypothetical protein